MEPRFRVKILVQLELTRIKQSVDRWAIALRLLLATTRKEPEMSSRPDCVRPDITVQLAPPRELRLAIQLFARVVGLARLVKSVRREQSSHCHAELVTIVKTAAVW
jgi:hypothetical protein